MPAEKELHPETRNLVCEYVIFFNPNRNPNLNLNRLGLGLGLRLRYMENCDTVSQANLTPETEYDSHSSMIETRRLPVENFSHIKSLIPLVMTDVVLHCDFEASDISRN